MKSHAKPARIARRMLPVGKLPQLLLKEQLKLMAARNGRLRIGPRYGEDATVIDMGDRLLICACDPITLASREIGRYAVHINANDVAVLGAQPRWFWATVLLPEGRSDSRLVDGVFSDMRAACADIGADICGGHTEITAGLDRPIVSGFMAGEVDRARLADKRTIRPGDRIILTRGIAIEGTATIAREAAGKLRRIDPEIVSRARGLLAVPGISIVREALLAVGAARVHGMHDPTEGGIYAGLRELAAAAGVGLEIEEERIPVLPETEAICGHLGIDPMGLLASGALLIAAGAGSSARILDAYKARGIPASIIGSVRERDFGVMLRRGARLVPIPEHERDEITRVL